MKEFFNKNKPKILSPKEKEELIAKKEQEKKDQTFKAMNLGEYHPIILSTGGRFSSPDIVHFKPYILGQIQDAKSCRPENIIETYINILEENKSTNATFEVANLLVDEVIDIAISLYGMTYSKTVQYPIYCDNPDCESVNIKDEQKPYFHALNMETVERLSVENIEDALRETYRKKLENNPDGLKDFIERQYGKDSDVTLEQVISDIKVKEPLKLVMPDNKVLEIKFVRIGEMAQAIRDGYAQFAYQLRKTNNKKYKNLELEDEKIQKQIDMEDLQIELYKVINERINAYCLVSFDGKPFITIDDKIKFYKNMPPTYEAVFKRNSEKLKFGIHHKFESQCPVCGEKKISDLEHSTLLYDFIPSADSRLFNDDASINPPGDTSGLNRIELYF